MSIILESKNLRKTYKNQNAVDDLSLQINEGDIYALLGLNGAGKTTFMKLVLKNIFPTSGEIQLNTSYHHIGTIVESPTFYDDLSGYDNLKMHALATGVDIKKINEVLQVVGLSIDKKKVKKYSLGMKQRLAIARTLLTSPKLLILDEPVNGLDPTGVYEVRSLLMKLNQEMGITIIISSHILQEVESIATRYGIIHQGKAISEFDAVDIEKHTTAAYKEFVDFASYRQELNLLKDRNGFVGSAYLDKKGYFYGSSDFLNQLENFEFEQTSLEKYFIAVTGGVRSI